MQVKILFSFWVLASFRTDRARLTVRCGEVKELLTLWGLTEWLAAVGADTTSSNTGVDSGEAATSEVPT